MADIITMPKLGLTMEKGTILTWLKREGEQVEKGEIILEIETDKIVSQVESPRSGTVLRILAEAGAEVPVRTPLAVVGKIGEEVSELSAYQKPADRAEGRGRPALGEGDVSKERGEKRIITPRARKLIKEHAIPLELFHAVEKKRITESDVDRVLMERRTGTEENLVPGELIPLSRSQRILGERMTESSRDIPQFSLGFRVEMDYALSLLERFSANNGMKITLNSLVLRAVAIALSRRPQVLRRYREGKLFQPAEVNIGLAVASDGEIIVPVIRNADRKNIVKIAGEASRYIEKARSKKLQHDDVSGGTITVTNLGMFGISSFVPLVNPGESAILGVGALQKAYREKEGSVETYHIAEFTLVCDHRSVNGAVGAAFCQRLTKTIETERELAW